MELSEFGVKLELEKSAFLIRQQTKVKDTKDAIKEHQQRRAEHLTRSEDNM